MWENQLAAAGCRVTEPRRAVMTVLAQSDVPLSPQAVMEQGQAVYPRLGLVTVYRTLELFEELGLVERVHVREGCHGYLTISPGHRHRLLCRECGRAVEFRGEDDLDGLLERVETETGYRVEHHLLQLVGICPMCRNIQSEP